MEAKWFPSEDVVAASNIAGAMADWGFADYDSFYEWSRLHRGEFWGYTARRLGIQMSTPAGEVLVVPDTPEQPDWFPGARLNIAESCFTADPMAIAVRYQGTGGLEEMTYLDLRTAANRFANALTGSGVSPGDKVAIAMPMNVEAVVAYLGTVLAGAVVVSIADSFSPSEIETRVRIAGAGLAITQDVLNRGGKALPMYRKMLDAGVEQAVVVDTGGVIELRPQDSYWADFLSNDEHFDGVQRRPGDHSNILFSSGTTGTPKAIPWTHAAPIKAAADGHYHHDIHSSDTVAWPTNLGWMMGPWLIYASLINGATMALYNNVPTGAGFAKFVEKAGVTVLGLVPSLVSAWRASGVAESCDWSQIRLFGSTGEASNASDMAYLMDLAGNKPIIDYIGGTEIAGGYMACTVVHPCIPATFTTPTLGGGIHILDADGRPSDSGEVFIEPPTMGLSVELLNRDHHEAYYEGTPDIGVVLRRHGDHIERMEDGHYRAQGRVDDMMNLGAIKVSSADIERAVQDAPGLQEAAAIAVEPSGGGPSSLVMYVVTDPGVEPEELKMTMQKQIRSRLNPLFKISDVVAVASLPRTASAKVMRRSLRNDYLDR